MVDEQLDQLNQRITAIRLELSKSPSYERVLELEEELRKIGDGLLRISANM